MKNRTRKIEACIKDENFSVVFSPGLFVVFALVVICTPCESSCTRWKTRRRLTFEPVCHSKGNPCRGRSTSTIASNSGITEMRGRAKIWRRASGARKQEMRGKDEEKRSKEKSTSSTLEIFTRNFRRPEMVVSIGYVNRSSSYVNSYLCFCTTLRACRQRQFRWKPFNGSSRLTGSYTRDRSMLCNNNSRIIDDSGAAWQTKRSSDGTGD